VFRLVRAKFSISRRGSSGCSVAWVDRTSVSLTFNRVNRVGSGNRVRIAFLELSEERSR